MWPFPLATPRRGTPRRRWAPLAFVAAIGVLALPGCSDKASLPASPARVEISMRESQFDYKPPASRGRTVFHVSNAGTHEHELVLVSLPKDLPPIQEQLRSKSRKSVGTVAFVKPLPPGKSAVFALDLQRGRYAMVCPLKSPDGMSYARKGMASEFSVR